MTRKRTKAPNTSKKLFTKIIVIVKQLWFPITGIIGALLLINQVVEIWKGNPSRINYIFLGIIVTIWFIALLTLTFGKSLGMQKGFFSKRIGVFHKSIFFYKLLSGGLVLITIISIALGITIILNRKAEISRAQDDKVVILITSFDDGDESRSDPYGIQNTLITKLNESLKIFEDVEVITLSDVITVTQGSKVARELGKKYQADIVIWGWYRPVENPVTIYIENLSSPLFSVVDPSQVYTPTANIDELKRVEYRQRIGSDIGSLVSFITGLIRYQKGDFKLAIEAFENSLLSVNDSDTLITQEDVFFFIGNSYFAMNDYHSSIDNYSKAIEINPEHGSAYNNRANAYMYTDNSELAMADFSKAIEIDPADPPTYSGRGALYNALGQYELAIQDLNIGIQINPNPEHAYNNRGFSYYNLHQYDKAIADYTKAIELDPQQAVSYHLRGQVYNDLKQYDKAISDYTKAITIYPKYARAFNDRGISYVMLEEYDKAFSDFNQSIYYCSQNNQCDKELATLYFVRGNAYIARGEQSKAIVDLTQAIQINPQYYLAYSGRANIYIKQKEYNKALDDLNILIQQNPNFASAYYDRGMTYKTLGKQSEADADFKKFQELTGVSVP